jgi:tRNA(fMet)-specific endonuclease VapC
MKRGQGKAHLFLAEHASACPCITWTIAGEFAEGFGNIEEPACAAMLSRFEVLAMDRNTAGEYARITARLRQENRLIGANDLWIAAAALAHGIALVTSNIAHFSRVAGLSLVSYR